MCLSSLNWLIIGQSSVGLTDIYTSLLLGSFCEMAWIASWMSQILCSSYHAGYFSVLTFGSISVYLMLMSIDV